MSWYWPVITIIIILTFSLAINVILVFRFVWTGPNSKLRQIVQNVLLVLFSLLFVFLLLELFFKLFFAQSDGFNYTLASKNWFGRYWRSNSLGYRDIEWTPELLEGKTRVMVLGDSFVAGHGIENPEDRFSNVLGRLLGDEYAVMNVGSNGANTKTEIESAIDYPYPPDVIVLSFYMNDILDTAKDMGYSLGQLKTGEPEILKPLIEESYAFNFLYWRLYRLGPHEWERTSWERLLKIYDNPDIWNVYKQELLQIHYFIEQRNGKLIVVVFPNITAVEESRPITSQVVELYSEQGIPVVDVTELIEGMDYRDLVASPVDSHPNEYVHRLVAEKLYQIFQDDQVTTSSYETSGR